MWTLRFLNGPKKGSYFPLSPGSNKIGRSSSCAIQIQSPGISKIHVDINIQDSEITLSDQNSSNGTYVNGVKINQQQIEMGDQVAMHDIIFDIVRSSTPARQAEAPPPPASSTPAYPNEENPNTFQTPNPDSAKFNLISWWENYLNNVILPGVYKLPEWMDFKWVIGFFCY